MVFTTTNEETDYEWDSRGREYLCSYSWLGASLMAQMVENLPAMLETWVQYLSLQDPLEKGVATDSSILAWRIP